MTDLSTRGPYAAAPGTIVAAVSAVSWGAVVAGAFVAASLTLILVALGSGLGLGMASFWHGSPSAVSFAIGGALWLIVVQWLSAAAGGYLAGRLRTRWIGTHEHEVMFRDTAHGFLTWAVATVIGALLLASATSALVGGGVQAASRVAGGAAPAAMSMMQNRAYDVDTLFRGANVDPSAYTSNSTTGASSPNNSRDEATRILTSGMAAGAVPDTDKAYLVNLVATRTGVDQAEAQKRVDQAIAQEQAAEAKAKQAADEARKAASRLAIFTALSMIVGAFIASVAAALGGRERDLHP